MERRYRPNKGTGHKGMMRNECEKREPSRWQDRGGVLVVGGGSAINSHDCDSGGMAGATEGRQNRISSPRVHKEGYGLIHYLEHNPGLSESERCPRVWASSIFVGVEELEDASSTWRRVVTWRRSDRLQVGAV